MRRIVSGLLIGGVLVGGVCRVEASSFKGHIVSVSDSVHSLEVQRPDDQVSMDFTLNDGTQIQKAGKIVSFNSLKEGDIVNVIYHSNTDVSRIFVASPHSKKAPPPAPAASSTTN